MRDMKKSNILFWMKIVAVLILVFIIFVCCVNSVSNDNEQIQLISLYLSAISIETSVVIAILIYYLQKKDSEQNMNNEIDRARSEMLFEIENAFSCSTFNDSDARDSWLADDVENVFKRNTFYLHHLLTNEEFKNLQRLINAIVLIRDHDDKTELSLMLKHFLRYIFLTQGRSLFSDFNYYDLFNEDIARVLAKLKDETFEYRDSINVQSIDGQTEIYREDDTIVHIIQNNHEVVNGEYNMTAKGKGYFSNGYSEISHPFYSGYYKNGKFDGEGKYDDLDSFKFGIWRKGKLVTGIEKDIFVYSKENILLLHGIHKNSISDLKMISCIPKRVYTIETLNETKNKFDIQKNDYIYVADLIYKNNKQYLSNIRTEQEFIYENQLMDMSEEPKG